MTSSPARRGGTNRPGCIRRAGRCFFRSWPVRMLIGGGSLKEQFEAGSVDVGVLEELPETIKVVDAEDEDGAETDRTEDDWDGLTSEQRKLELEIALLRSKVAKIKLRKQARAKNMTVGSTSSLLKPEKNMARQLRDSEKKRRNTAATAVPPVDVTAERNRRLKEYANYTKDHPFQMSDFVVNDTKSEDSDAPIRVPRLNSKRFDLGDVSKKMKEEYGDETVGDIEKKISELVQQSSKYEKAAIAANKKHLSDFGIMTGGAGKWENPLDALRDIRAIEEMKSSVVMENLATHFKKKKMNNIGQALLTELHAKRYAKVDSLARNSENVTSETGDDSGSDGKESAEYEDSGNWLNTPPLDTKSGVTGQQILDNLFAFRNEQNKGKGVLIEELGPNKLPTENSGETTTRTDCVDASANGPLPNNAAGVLL